MHKIADFFKDEHQRLNVLMLIAFALISFFVVLHHEIWRDEGYVWVSCRDCGFFELWKNVAVEGHPPLWYLLVLPLAKSGLSVFSMQILAWFLAVLGAGFFVFKSPFNNFLKFTFLFSSGMIYWYAVISRSYSLFPLLIFLLAYLYPKSQKHPYLYGCVLALVANTHIIMFAFCCALLGVFLWDEILKNKKPIGRKSAQITVFSLLLLDFACICGAILWGKTQNIGITDYILPGFWDVFENLARGINGIADFSYCIVIFLICFAYLLYKKNKKMLFVFSASFIYQFLIYKYIWGILPQRAFLILLVGLFCFWVILEQSKEKMENFQLFFALIFLSSFLIGTKYVTQDLLFDFSGSKSVARYIKQHIPEECVITTDDTETKASIFAYLKNRKFWSLTNNEFYTIEKWNTNFKQRNNLNIPEQFLDNDTYLVTTRIGLPIFAKNIKCKPIYINNVKVIHENEDFIICKFARNNKKTEKNDGK